MQEYNGSTVYLGIDVHKKTYAVTAIHDGRVVKRDTLPADPNFFIEYCRRYFKGARIVSAYEAGFCGFSLHRALCDKGIESHVINPSGIETKAGDRVKTDKKDSMKLASQLYQGRIQGIHVPSQGREGYREITRLRDSLVSARARIGVQMKMLLFRHGYLKFDDNRHVSKKWLASFLQDLPEGDAKYCFERYAESWLKYGDLIKGIEGKIGDQACQDRSIEDVYRSAPGIGPVSARSLANELGDMSQFSSQKKLYCFTGLTPWEFSSGEHQRLGHISRQGRSRIRGILIEVAWRAIKDDDSLRAVFESISQRQGKKRAIVAVARRLIGRIRACFVHGTLYHSENENDEECLCAATSSHGL